MRGLDPDLAKALPKFAVVSKTDVRPPGLFSKVMSYFRGDAA